MKHTELGQIRNTKKQDYFYPEVCDTSKFIEWFSFYFFNIKKWKRIGVHNNNQFGLYSDLEYPCSSEKDAMKIISSYKKSYFRRREFVNNEADTSFINVD